MQSLSENKEAAAEQTLEIEDGNTKEKFCLVSTDKKGRCAGNTKDATGTGKVNHPLRPFSKVTRLNYIQDHLGLFPSQVN